MFVPRKILPLVLGAAICFVPVVDLNGQTIEMLVDQSQSTVTATILTEDDDTSVTGTATLEIVPEPSATAQLTELNLVLADGFSISFLGFVSATAAPGDVSLFMVTPGAPGEIDMSDQFDQIGNEIGFSGEIQILDPAGLVGGSVIINLEDEDNVLYDIVDAQLANDGEALSLTSEIDLQIPLVDSVSMTVTGSVRLYALIGDANLDGVVTLLDVDPFVDRVVSGTYQFQADCNQDGEVSLLDVAPFVALLTAG